MPQAADFFHQPLVLIENIDPIHFQRLIYLHSPIFELKKIQEEIFLKTARAKAKSKIPVEKIWLGTYFDQEIEKGLHPSVSIRKIDGVVGLGVFAERRILPHAWVGEYTGVICERTEQELKGKNYCVRLKVWEMGKRNFVIDAAERGNFTRFINHSDKPNIALQSIYWRGMPRMIFTALHEIQKGIQLTFDYGTIFWKENSQYPKVRL